jgi:methionyl-tRNA formyltransferase
MSIRALFLGTPVFALPSLAALFEDENVDLRAVLTQPDKPSGRGMKLTPTPVKQFAEQHKIPVFQPKSLKDELDTEPLWDFLKASGPYDVFVCVAYGKVIPIELLYFSAVGTINVHPSLLPRWRGAAPLQRTIFEGDHKTGVCLMRLDEGLDTGPVYISKEYHIRKDETFGSLSLALSDLGAQLLIENLPQINDGSLSAKGQGEQGITYAEKWDKKELFINWKDDAVVSERRIRASAPIPGARAVFNQQQLKILKALVVENRNFPASPPGTIVEVNRAEVIIACGENSFLSLLELQFPGKSRLNVVEILKGKSFNKGELFS